MTLRELYENGKKYLNEAGVEAPAFDALCIFEKIFGGGRSFLAIHGRDEAYKETEFQSMIKRRAGGEPLQYILGEWEFLSLKLLVKPGVLIPRSDTELLCETAVRYLKSSGGTDVLDLCAGTGAVGIGICSLYPKAKAVCGELYDIPFECLEENIKRYACYDVRAKRTDVLSESAGIDEKYDGIVSNPPYVKKKDIPFLQREVLREPREALDGGEDGLIFYRAILKNWLRSIRSGGFIAFEIGEDQGEEVKKLMEDHGICDAVIFKDLSGLDRVAAGTVK